MAGLVSFLVSKQGRFITGMFHGNSESYALIRRGFRTKCWFSKAIKQEIMLINLFHSDRYRWWHFLILFIRRRILPIWKKKLNVLAITFPRIKATRAE